jgi:hypothetical protein
LISREGGLLNWLRDEGACCEAIYPAFDKGTICARIWTVGPKDKEERRATKRRRYTRLECGSIEKPIKNSFSHG